jgi:hypothetical protein
MRRQRMTDGLTFNHILIFHLALRLATMNRLYDIRIHFFYSLYILNMHGKLRSYFNWLYCRLNLRVTCNQGLQLILQTDLMRMYLNWAVSFEGASFVKHWRFGLHLVVQCFQFLKGSVYVTWILVEFLLKVRIGCHHNICCWPLLLKAGHSFGSHQHKVIGVGHQALLMIKWIKLIHLWWLLLYHSSRGIFNCSSTPSFLRNQRLPLFFPL